MVEGVDGEKVWVCRKLCRQVDRVYLGEIVCYVFCMKTFFILSTITLLRERF